MAQGLHGDYNGATHSHNMLCSKIIQTYKLLESEVLIIYF